MVHVTGAFGFALAGLVFQDLVRKAGRRGPEAARIDCE